MSIPKKRRYSSKSRAESADTTRQSILEAARLLFSKKGIDCVTISDIAKKAGTAASTIYALFKSKEGILRELMRTSLFGDKFSHASKILSGVEDPVELIKLTPLVSRAIYESENAELGLVRYASGFSPALRKIEIEFDNLRLEMQAPRLSALFAAGKNNKNITETDAQRILWLLTSRDIYRMLVHESGWSPQKYQDWLSRILISELTNS